MDNRIHDVGNESANDALTVDTDYADCLSVPARSVLTSRVEDIRELIFQAQAIVDVTAAASESEAPVRWHGIRQALDIAYSTLNRAAAQLDPEQLLNTEVRHGET